MTRLLIAAAALSLFAAQAARADDYPMCKHRGDDHCRVMGGGMGMGHGHHHHVTVHGGPVGDEEIALPPVGVLDPHHAEGLGDLVDEVLVEGAQLGHRSPRRGGSVMAR